LLKGPGLSRVARNAVQDKEMVRGIRYAEHEQADAAAISGKPGEQKEIAERALSGAGRAQQQESWYRIDRGIMSSYFVPEDSRITMGAQRVAISRDLFSSMKSETIFFTLSQA